MRRGEYDQWMQQYWGPLRGFPPPTSATGQGKGLGRSSRRRGREDWMDSGAWSHTHGAGGTGMLWRSDEKTPRGQTQRACRQNRVCEEEADDLQWCPECSGTMILHSIFCPLNIEAAKDPALAEYRNPEGGTMKRFYPVRPSEEELSAKNIFKFIDQVIPDRENPVGSPSCHMSQVPRYPMKPSNEGEGNRMLTQFPCCESWPNEKDVPEAELGGTISTIEDDMVMACVSYLDFLDGEQDRREPKPVDFFTREEKMFIMDREYSSVECTATEEVTATDLSKGHNAEEEPAEERSAAEAAGSTWDVLDLPSHPVHEGLTRGSCEAVTPAAMLNHGDTEIVDEEPEDLISCVEENRNRPPRKLRCLRKAKQRSLHGRPGRRKIMEGTCTAYIPSNLSWVASQQLDVKDGTKRDVIESTENPMTRHEGADEAYNDITVKKGPTAVVRAGEQRNVSFEEPSVIPDLECAQPFTFRAEEQSAEGAGPGQKNSHTRDLRKTVRSDFTVGLMPTKDGIQMSSTAEREPGVLKEQEFIGVHRSSDHSSQGYDRETRQEAGRQKKEELEEQSRKLRRMIGKEVPKERRRWWKRVRWKVKCVFGEMLSWISSKDGSQKLQKKRDGSVGNPGKPSPVLI